MAVTFDEVREAAKELPDVEDASSWGNPALKVKGKLLAVWKDSHQGSDTLVLRVPLPDKDFLLAADPALFWTTPHYDGYAAVLIRMKVLKKRDLAELLHRSWKFLTAPKPRPRPKAKPRARAKARARR